MGISRQHASAARARHERERSVTRSDDKQVRTEEREALAEQAEKLQERARIIAEAQLGSDAPVHEINKRIEDVLLHYGEDVPELSDEQLANMRAASGENERSKDAKVDEAKRGPATQDKRAETGHKG